MASNALCKRLKVSTSSRIADRVIPHTTKCCHHRWALSRLYLQGNHHECPRVIHAISRHSSPPATCLLATTNRQWTVSGHDGKPSWKLSVSHDFQRVRKRFFSIDAIPLPLLPPLVFSGLVLVLWTYKCMMMVLFQDKIIYMPSIPPFSRSERIEDYRDACLPVLWKEKRIKSLDGTELALGLGSIVPDARSSEREDVLHKPLRIYILYFQGNASSLPPRLPALSSILRQLHQNNRKGCQREYTFVAPSYRGFWKSRGRASQKGIELDASAALKFVRDELAPPNPSDMRLILWGQSIGSGVAVDLAMRDSRLNKSSQTSISGILMETPFMSISTMLRALYPQKWLPYRYLSPFLWNWWDTETALKILSESEMDPKPKLRILEAAQDEVVPAGQAESLHNLSKSIGFDAKLRSVPAYHTNIMIKAQGKAAIVESLLDLTEEEEHYQTVSPVLIRPPS